MKKTLSFFGALAATALILSSCKGDDPAAPFLTVKDADGKAPASTVSFDATAGSKTFTIESNGKWSISKPESASWLTVNPSSGTGNKTVSISAEACAETVARSVELKFMLEGNQKASFTVQQSGAEPYLNIKDAEGEAAANTLAFEDEAGEVTYTLESNTAWSVTGATEWLTVDPASGSNNGTVKVSASANALLEPRTATLKFLVGTAEKLVVAVTQKAAVPFLTVTPETETVSHGGGTTAITIETNVDDVQAVITGDWLSKDDAASTATSLVLKIAINTTAAAKTGKIKFSSPTQTSLTKEVNLTQTFMPAVADMIDVEFKQDGTAENKAAWNAPAKTIPGERLSVYMNTTYGRYAARFTTNNLGGEAADSYYKIDYKDDAAFIDGLKDGYTIECLCMANFESNGEETKPFASHEGGGNGILVTKPDKNNKLTFLPHTGDYRWAYSGIQPIKGTFYHIVGVYDKTAGKAHTYLNGELKISVDAPGDLTVPTNPNAKWFAVGGDATSVNNGDRVGNVWDGDVVIARIYNDMLTQEDVTVLWNRVKK